MQRVAPGFKDLALRTYRRVVALHPAADAFFLDEEGGGGVGGGGGGEAGANGQLRDESAYVSLVISPFI